MMDHKFALILLLSTCVGVLQAERSKYFKSKLHCIHFIKFLILFRPFVECKGPLGKDSLMKLVPRIFEKGLNENGLPNFSFQKLLTMSSEEILKEGMKGDYGKMSKEKKK